MLIPSVVGVILAVTVPAPPQVKATFLLIGLFLGGTEAHKMGYRLELHQPQPEVPSYVYQ